MDRVTFDSPAAFVNREADDVAEQIVNLDPVESDIQYSPEQQQLLNTFPWVSELNKFFRADIGVANMRSLDRMMKFFLKQVNHSFKECLTRPNRAAKLKRAMSDILFFFHMTYSEFKAPLEHSSYLAKMSDLMAMYLDMEIKASRTGTESLPKIASKLTSALHVYFGQSQEHILDTILKAKIISRNFWELSDLIFRWVLRDSPSSTLHIFMYIRYLLAFKKWKSIMKGAEEKRQIIRLATCKLRAPPGFREKMSADGVLRDLLPRVPKSRTDVTLFLMQAKFAVNDKSKLFLKAVMDPKLQCALDRQSFLTIGSLGKPEQGERESNSLMNDIWSSMNIASTGRDPLHLNHFGDKKKYLKGKNLRKGKPDHLKRRRKKIEMLVEEIGEDDKPTNEISDVVRNIKLEVEDNKPVIEPEEETNVLCEADDTMEIAAEVELSSNPTQDSENPSVKEEPLALHSKNPVEYQMVWNGQNFQAYYSPGYGYEMHEKPLEYVLPNDPSLNTENQAEVYAIETKDSENIEIMDDSNSCFAESISNNVETEVTYSAKGEIIEQEYKEPEFKEEEFKEPEIKEHDFKDTAIVRSGLNTEQVINESEYKMPDEMVANEDFDGNKPVDKDMDVVANIEDNGMGLLHDYTIKSDRKMFEFQTKVYSYSTKLNPQTWIGLLSPVFCEQSRLKMYRCWCAECKNNLSVIRRNWKSVMGVIMLNSEKNEEERKNNDDENGYTCKDTLEDLKAIAEGEKGDIMYWEAEIENLLKRIDEYVKENSESSSLPLKKRKAFSYNNSNSYTKEEKSTEIAYPCTPMISIAEVELMKEKLCFNNTMPITPNPAVPPTTVSYLPNYSTQTAFSSVTDPKYNSVIVQSAVKPVAPEQSMVPNLVPGAYTTTFLPCQKNKVTFKTPAQLKQFQQLSAAQDLLNFAHTSRTECESQAASRKRQPRRTKISRKRKGKQT